MIGLGLKFRIRFMYESEHRAIIAVACVVEGRSFYIYSVQLPATKPKV